MALSVTAQKAKSIRQELGKAFPQVKFSVRCDSGRGSAIRVKWVDGVTYDQVESITRKYEDVRRCEASGEILLGGNTYIFTERKYSLDVLQNATDHICKKWGVTEQVELRFSDTYGASFYTDVCNVGNGIKRLSTLTYEYLKEIDLTQSEAVEVEPEETVDQPVVQPEDNQDQPELVEDETELDSTVQDVLEQRRKWKEEKDEYRESRYEELAAKHTRLSNERYEQSKKMASVIPFGQPILVGHYSERSDRNYRKKIRSNMDKSIEHDKTAQYYQEKLEAMKHNQAISSDDPDALQKLKKKLAGMEECQEYMKRINKAIRKINKLDCSIDEKVSKLCETEQISEKDARSLLMPDWVGRTGFASFQLSNNSQNMKTVKERIATLERQLERISEQGESADTEYEDIGLIVRENNVINRVQLIFDGKPSEQIRDIVKRAGFRWARSEMAWQRQLNFHAVRTAHQTAKDIQSLMVKA